MEAVCVPAEPLPTWAAPATPPQPQGLRVSPSYEKPENDSETGIPDGSERNGLASESQDEEAVEAVAVSEKDFSRMRAKLEATRNELVEKMAELMKLEANLSVALGEKPTAWSCLPSSEPVEPAEASDAAMHATSLSAQSSIEMQDRAIGVVAEEYECESSVASFQAPEKGCNTRAVGTTTDDLMATASDDNVKDLKTSQTSSSPDKKDASRSDTARSAPSRAGSGGSGSSGRVSALLNAPPVSARLSLRRRGSQTAKEASPDTKEFGELSGLRRSASATMANKLRRSSSAKELTGQARLKSSDLPLIFCCLQEATTAFWLPTWPGWWLLPRLVPLLQFRVGPAPHHC